MTAQESSSSIQYWLPLAVWVFVILAVSSIPGPTLLKVGFSVQDSVAHGAEYSVLGFLVYRWRRALGRKPAASLLAALGVGLLLGSIDEFYQGFIPGRIPSVADLGADGLGAITGASIALVYYALLARLARTSSTNESSPDDTGSGTGEDR